MPRCCRVAAEGATVGLMDVADPAGAAAGTSPTRRRGSPPVAWPPGHHATARSPRLGTESRFGPTNSARVHRSRPRRRCGRCGGSAGGWVSAKQRSSGRRGLRPGGPPSSGDGSGSFHGTADTASRNSPTPSVTGRRGRLPAGGPEVPGVPRSSTSAPRSRATSARQRRSSATSDNPACAAIASPCSTSAHVSGRSGGWSLVLPTMCAQWPTLLCGRDRLRSPAAASVHHS